MIEFLLNNALIKTEKPPGMVMLDFIRYEKNLKGTKIGCREGDCGACTVLVGSMENGQMVYKSMTSCLMPIANAQGKHIVSVEGINLKEPTFVQSAIVEENGSQCGFCTVGFVMSMTGYAMSGLEPTPQNGIAAVDGNICRCTGYKSLERALERINHKLAEQVDSKSLIDRLVDEKFVPEYFKNIPERLKAIKPQLRPNLNGVKVGGGTDLYVQKHESMVHAEATYTYDESALKYIKRVGNTFHIGAASTVTDLKNSPLMQEIFPDLDEHLKLVSSTPIRNMATLAGNFVNASPIGDMTIFFLALNARLVLTSENGNREVALKQFYKGYKTLDLKPEEKVDSILFSIPDSGFRFGFRKVCKRTYLDIASVNAALSIFIEANKIKHVHAALGGVFAYPKYLAKTCNFLTDKALSPDLLWEAVAILDAEIAPISDARGDEKYKRLLARQLFLAHFSTLYPELIQPEKIWKTA